MKHIALSLLMFASLALVAVAQDAPTQYTESYRKGTVVVTEDSFEAKLTPADAIYKERIKDSRGNDRYDLTIVPQGPEGDTKITSWKVIMKDLRHSFYANVLMADQQPSADAANNLWWLNPDRFSPVPIRAKRVVKVDGFYVVMEVKALHFTPLDSPYLDSMTVAVTVTNTDPRQAK